MSTRIAIRFQSRLDRWLRRFRVLYHSRATLGSSAAEIARLLGWSVATVHMIHSRYSREGDALFDLKSKGGRRNQYLTLEEEAELNVSPVRREPG